MDYIKYLNAFVDEANENVHALNRYLLDLEQTSGNPVLLKGLFRSVHTLKASSQTMGFNRIAKLSHEMEDIISDIQRGRIELNSDVFDLLFRIADSFESFLFNICEFGNEGKTGADGLIEEIAGLLGKPVLSDATPAIGAPGFRPGAADDDYETNMYGARAIQTGNAEAPGGPIGNTRRNEIDSPPGYNAYEQAAIKNAFTDGRTVYEIEVSLDRNCLMKAARALIIIQALEKQGDIIRSKPNIEAIEDERFGLAFTVTILSNAGLEALQSALGGLSEIERFAITEVAPGMFDTRVDRMPGAIEGGMGLLNAENANHLPREGLKSDLTGGSARIGLYQLDSLQNRITEHSNIVASIIGQLPKSPAKKLAGLIARLEQSVAGLENAISSLSTAPLSDIFDSFPKIFGELTEKLGKNARLSISGGEMRCEIGLISRLRQPLLHLLRNSVDHGIEPPDVRIAKGKDMLGSVSVNAYKYGGQVIIEVEDDGAGVNLAKVREKAVKAGIISEIEAKSISKEAILRLIFQPMLSTREYISMYSGRGVGMDVVKARTEDLGGVVEINSEEGCGTKISLKIPYADLRCDDEQ